MNKVIITDKIIQGIAPDARSEFHVWDSQLPGWGLRVRKSGHKTYVMFYRPRDRMRIRKLTLGSATAIKATEARRQAREILGQIAAGKDPADERLAYRDSSLRIPGLVLRIRSSGHKSYVLYYRVDGCKRTRKIRIATAGAVTLEMARDIARQHLMVARMGKDPTVWRFNEIRRRLEKRYDDEDSQ
jgi:hypothetical protein